MRFFAHDGKTVLGPSELEELLKLPGFDGATLVCPVGSEDSADWKPALAYPPFRAALLAPAPKPTPPPSPSAPPPAPTKPCPSCAHANPEGARFCNACAARMNPLEEPKPAAPAPEPVRAPEPAAVPEPVREPEPPLASFEPAVETSAPLEEYAVAAEEPVAAPASRFSKTMLATAAVVLIAASALGWRLLRRPAARAVPVEAETATAPAVATPPVVPVAPPAPPPAPMTPPPAPPVQVSPEPIAPTTTLAGPVKKKAHRSARKTPPAEPPAKRAAPVAKRAARKQHAARPEPAPTLAPPAATNPVAATDPAAAADAAASAALADDAPKSPASAKPAAPEAATAPAPAPSAAAKTPSGGFLMPGVPRRVSPSSVPKSTAAATAPSDEAAAPASPEDGATRQVREQFDFCLQLLAQGAYADHFDTCLCADSRQAAPFLGRSDAYVAALKKAASAGRLDTSATVSAVALDGTSAKVTTSAGSENWRLDEGLWCRAP